MLSSSETATGQQRGARPERREARGEYVIDGHGQERGAVGLDRSALSAHDAAHRLDDWIEAGPATERTGVAEGADRHGDDPWVHGGQLVVRDAEPTGDAGAVVIHDDVRRANEVVEQQPVAA